jgi:hypothetical protein
MPREDNIPFLPLIKELFDPIFKDFGFNLTEEVKWDGMGEYVITAQKGDIVLNFYLGISQLFYYCDLALKLSGELGKRATSGTKYLELSVSVIAECLDPDYKTSGKMPQTKDEIKLAFESRKEELLKYCGGILSGDVSNWQRAIKLLK